MKEGNLCLCEALSDQDWITAEGLIEVTFANSRWVHIDNDTEHVFDLGARTEVATLEFVDQELSVEDLNQLTAEPVEADIIQVGIDSAEMLKLMVPK